MGCGAATRARQGRHTRPRAAVDWWACGEEHREWERERTSRPWTSEEEEEQCAEEGGLGIMKEAVMEAPGSLRLAQGPGAAN